MVGKSCYLVWGNRALWATVDTIGTSIVTFLLTALGGVLVQKRGSVIGRVGWEGGKAL